VLTDEFGLSRNRNLFDYKKNVNFANNWTRGTMKLIKTHKEVPLFCANWPYLGASVSLQKFKKITTEKNGRESHHLIYHTTICAVVMFDMALGQYPIIHPRF